MYKMSAERLEGLQKMTQFTPESQSYTHETPGYSKKSNFPPPRGVFIILYATARIVDENSI